MTVTTTPAASTAAAARPSFGAAFETLGYEVLPFKGTAEKIQQFVPASVRLTVTASPNLPIERTVQLAAELARAGYAVAPHLAAKMIRDRDHLGDLVANARAAGVKSVFVIGGDAEQAGEFPDAITLLRGLREIDHGFDDIGVGGYPEGHAAITADALQRSLVEKAGLANHVVTQICFDAGVTLDWARRCKQSGMSLPIHVGMPGAVSRQKLMRISAASGVGDSMRFLKKQQGMFWRFFVPGGYSPNKLLKGLRPAFASDDTSIAGFHIFTFNDLERTEAWRQQMVRRYGSDTGEATNPGVLPGQRSL